MAVRVGINGFGRVGRLALRAGFGVEGLEFVAINEPSASAETMALLLEFDTVQGRWDMPCGARQDGLFIGDQRLEFWSGSSPDSIPWQDAGVDLVMECSGRFRTSASLQPHLDGGARRVLVSAPVPDGPPNVVVGVNDQQVDFAREPIVTAASCTTNCLAPIVRVLHDKLGIERGLVTTIHDPTNTQRVVDAAHKDPRRARAAQANLIPTSSNSAQAVTLVIPELAGKIDSIAVRAPVLNASLTDCVLHVARDTTVEEVNGFLEAAASEGPLAGVLGFETRPLVSSDYARNANSATVDALSTRVTDGRMVKVLAWYDNEWGYANRMVDLASKIAERLS